MKLTLMATRLLEKRLELHLTQRQVAEMMTPPVARETVSNWERGKKVPSVKRLGELAKIFNTTMDYLSGE